MSDKYEPLQAYLKAQASDLIQLSFAKIEDIIKAKLPPSARKLRPWWSNNPSNSVITKAWLNAGYRSEQVDMQRERLVFRRQPQPAPSFDARIIDRDFLQDSAAMHAKYATPFYGCMKGIITVSDDCDLTAPADANWDASAEEV